jgi:glucokinase
MADVLLGIDLGGTQIKCGAVSLEGKIVGHDVRPTPADDGPDAVADAMAESARAALIAAGNPKAHGAGVGAPGPLNWQTGIVFSPPNLAGWHNVPLAEMMRARLGVPCFVDNDANLACYGEFCAGAGRGVQDMCMLTLGTGVGGGIVVFGKLLRGIDGTAAEIGHITVQRDGRQCGCGARGCLEAYASVTGLVHTAIEGIESGSATSLIAACGGDVHAITGKMVSEQARAGDGFARWVIEETGDWIGVGIASLINLLNPEKVVIGGGMIAAGDLLLNAIRARAKKDAFEVPARRAQIVIAELQEEAGVIGAAMAARERLAGRV